MYNNINYNSYYGCMQVPVWTSLQAPDCWLNSFARPDVLVYQSESLHAEGEARSWPSMYSFIFAVGFFNGIGVLRVGQASRLTQTTKLVPWVDFWETWAQSRSKLWNRYRWLTYMYDARSSVTYRVMQNHNVLTPIPGGEMQKKIL